MARGRQGRVLLLGALVAAAAVVPTAEVLAGKPPRVDRVLEGRATGLDVPVVRLEGRGLKKVTGARLRDLGGADRGRLEVFAKSNKAATFLVPAGTEPGTYDLLLETKKGDSYEVRATLRAGGLLAGSVKSESLEGALRADLDDARTLVGEEVTHFVDAGSQRTGTLPPQRYDSVADLTTEGWVGGSGRLVPALISTREDLEDEGYLGADGNLGTDHFSAWEDLEAEGVADGSGKLAADRYSAWADLGAEGHLGGTGKLGPADYSAWEDLQAEGFVDGGGELGTGNYSAYGSLSSNGRIGSGTAQAAAGDHDHAGDYLPVEGGTITGTLRRTGATGTPALAVHGSQTSATGDIVVLRSDFQATNLLGYGAWFVNDATGALVNTRIAATGARAIHAETASTSGAAIDIVATGDGLSAAKVYVEGVDGGVEVYGLNEGGGVGLYAEALDAGGPVLSIETAIDSAGDRSGSSLATFETASARVARIDQDGKGYFNGGLQTGGADFAERVRVTGTEGSPEAGTVLAIDPRAERGFRVCAEAESARVAGVVSAKPGVLGSPGPVAEAEAPPDEVPMAIVGIVSVRVCDEGGAIEPGDLLVSASVAGHARKAPERPRAGTVLGKALGTLEEGRGTVEVLLRLK